jgi:tetratricopeptide (TPR) repeat protein
MIRSGAGMVVRPPARHIRCVCSSSIGITEPLRDGRGLAISSSSAHARDACDAALLRLHGGHADVNAYIDGALRHDADCVIAHCLRAATLLVAAERPHDPATAAVLCTLDRLDPRANDRERRLAAGAREWFAGDVHRALACFDGLLIDYPRDSLALQLAHALDFRLGHREMLRDRVAQVLPHWHAGIPGFGHVLAMYAFGLEEAGDYRLAESTARRSLQLIPGNAAAIHVIAHVWEMQGRTLEGIAWLESTRGDWAANAAFGLHIAWHLALFHLDNDDVAAAVAIYDRTFAPTRTSSIPALVDASALLWRLELRGVRLHARWRRLARC